MNLLRKTISFRRVPLSFYALIIFFILHIVLFNINTAEWGDSYRILRASEYIRQGSYPVDEKRPPLFSIFTAIRPSLVDAVMWGRVVVLVFSLLAFLTFNELLKIYVKENKYRFLALLFFIFNPVYLYWSLRIMADVPFSFFVLLAFYVARKFSNKSFLKLIFLGFISGLSILTRFEGYLLFGSVIIGSFFTWKEVEKLIKSKKSFTSNLLDFFSRKWKAFLILGLTTLFTIMPWVLYRNPLKSSYFEETYRRIYDFKMIWIYFVSIIYSFGFTSAFYFIFYRFKTTLLFIKENIDITTFVALEMFLILLWPAAIPRLFVCLMPFFIIILTLCIKNLFENELPLKKNQISMILIPILLLLFYIISQYFLKLQFLITNKKIFVILILLQILAILFTYFKKPLFLISTILASTIFWSLSIIISHKEIYTAIKSASIYSRDNLSGKFIYNDTTSTADWYINYSMPRKDTRGEKWYFLNKEDLSYNDLLVGNVSYVITTNEDGVGFDSGVERLEYLKLIKSFRYNIGSKEFFANIFKFEGQK